MASQSHLLSEQPFWTAHKENSSVLSLQGHLFALLHEVCTEKDVWDTIPGQGNITLYLADRYGKPEVICIGLKDERSATHITPTYVDSEGKCHYEFLRLGAGDFARFFHESTHRLNQKLIPLSDILPAQDLAEQWAASESTETRKAVLTDFFLKQGLCFKASQQNALARNIDQIIHKHLGRISVSELSSELNYSVRYLHNITRDQIGIGTKTHCNNIRLQYILTILKRNPDCSIEALSEQFGFFDSSHLYRAFEDTIGTPLSDVRYQFRTTSL